MMPFTDSYFSGLFMIFDEKIIDALIAFFNSTTWPLDVDESKLRSRYAIVQDDSWPGFDVVEIERHRAAMGASYRRGLPMSAMQTYYMRYAINRVDLHVRILPERQDEAGPAFDVDMLVDEHLSPEGFDLRVTAIDTMHYEIREEITHEKETIADLDEAKEFALSFEDALVERFDDDISMDYPQLDEDKRERLSECYKAALHSALKQKAEEAWEERETWDEEE